MASTWKTRWEELRRLPAGGQGSPHVVRLRDGSDGTERVLKLLNEPRDPDRRARMAREIAALRTLDGRGVPKFIESNWDAATNTGELYVVMEYVPGPTLEQYVKPGPRPLEEALAITEAAVNVLERSHESGLLHRDIKPDNIVLRDGDPVQPVLLDFGLSVEIAEEENLTETEQQIGNRFLGLPEHRSPGDNKRDPRSDITLCTALLFYIVTGRQPMTLEDGEGHGPHKRPDVQERFATIDDGRLVPLTRLFDIAFQPRVSERVQSIDELRQMLEDVHCRNGAAPPVKPAATVKSLWTLHMVDGRPNALYFHHEVIGSPDLVPFFEGSNAPEPLGNFASDQAQAAAVVWSEIVAHSEVRSYLPAHREFHRARDHVNHILDEDWAAMGAPTTHLRWNRELEVPTGRIGGPTADIPLALLSAGANAAVRFLDAAARSHGASALEAALSQQASW